MTARMLWALTATVVLLVIGSLGLAAREMGFLTPGRVTTLPPDLRAPVRSAARPEAPDLGVIAARGLFGTPARAAPDRQAPAVSPEALGLSLQGVMIDADPARSRALIVSQGRLAGYRPGDRIAEGIALDTVQARSVTLAVGPDRVRLGFDGAGRLDGTPTDPGAQGSGQPGAAPEPVDPMARLRAAIVPGRGSLDLRDTPPPETMDEHIAHWRNRIIADPAAVMDTIGVERTGRGYKVRPDPNIGVTLAGLKPGDLVTRLNGRDLGDLDRDRALYDAVAAEGFARLEVERAGETLLMTYSLR